MVILIRLLLVQLLFIFPLVFAVSADNKQDQQDHQQ